MSITRGLPPMKDGPCSRSADTFREHYDELRTGLMWEPRGHADMYGAIVTPSENADFDVFFLHNEGYSTMCGHAIIALDKARVRDRSGLRGDAQLTSTCLPARCAPRR